MSITHSLDYMAQIHARQTMTESTSELCWSLTPDYDNATVSCYETYQRCGFASQNDVATVLTGNPDGPAEVICYHVDIS